MINIILRQRNIRKDVGSVELLKNIFSCKQKRYQLNHDGSTLLMIIICIAFLGILGTLMLSVSMINLQMKRVESKSKDNFYYCETALEEIRSGIQETAVEAIKEIYKNELLPKYIIYAAMDENTRSKRIQKMVLDKMRERLAETNTDILLDTDLDHIADNFKKYLSFYKEDTSLSVDNFNISLGHYIEQELTTDYTLLFQDVKIEFIQGGYSASITTDMRVTLPSFTFKPATDTVTLEMKQPFTGYALAADGEILSENSEGENSVTGNIYSGAGITVRDTDCGMTDAHKLILDGNCIATRGDILAVDTAELSIGHAIRPYLWADNIKTQTTGDYLVGNSHKTRLDINAISLIKDDLSVDGRNSEVILSGAYAGYTGGFNVKSSAMMINGSGSSLELESLSSLVLAGRANVTVEGSKSSSYDQIITGESLALKSNQRAYLVPGEYIKLPNGASEPLPVLHNPITQRDIDSGSLTVDIPDIGDPEKLNYFTYIKPEQYVEVNRQSAAGGNGLLRYYYLNFRNGKLADQFLADYMDRYSETLQVMGNFSLGDIKLPKNPDGSVNMDKIVSVGNIMSYTTDPSDPEPVKLTCGLSGSYTDDNALNNTVSEKNFSTLSAIYRDTVFYNQYKGIDRKIKELSGMYDNLTLYLDYDEPDEEYKKLDKGAQVVQAKVKGNGIDTITPGYVPKSEGFTFYDALTDNRWQNNDSNVKSMVVADGDVEIAPDSYFNGFLMASGKISIGERAIINGIVVAAGNGSTSGDVTVSDGARVYGRIIAEGDIRLGEGCSINCTGNTSFDAGLPVENFLESLFMKDGQQLWKLFTFPEIYVNSTGEGSEADLVDINNLVSYENWRRN